jgi:hypothetical protein
VGHGPCAQQRPNPALLTVLGHTAGGDLLGTVLCRELQLEVEVERASELELSLAGEFPFALRCFHCISK